VNYDLAISARRIVTPTGERPGVVGIRDGRIAAIADHALDAADQVELADDEVLLPGIVDSHVHVNEPGRTEWEGFATATKAAAAGGVTTIIDMPLNSVPPTTDPAALAVKQAATNGKRHVDIGFWGGAVPGNTADLAALHEAGVFGFKAFTLDSGVDEFGHLDHDQLAQVMQRLADLDAMLIVHAEDAATIAAAPPATGPRYADFLASRPRAAENTAIADLLTLAGHYGTRLHILHLSSSDALPMLRDAKRAGVRVTAETCPHYLTFTAEDIPDGATQFKCCPPIRDDANRDALWAGLLDGSIDCVVSDHSPCTVAAKRLDTGDFGAAWGGIASVQLSLPAVWTGAARRGIGLDRVAAWMAAAPATLTGLADRGTIQPGARADLCDHPEVAPAYVEEILRYKTPVQFGVRWASADTEVMGVPVPAGGEASGFQRQMEVIDVIDGGDVMNKHFDTKTSRIGDEEHPHSVVRAGRAKARPAALLATIDCDALRAQFREVSLRAILREAPVEQGHDRHGERWNHERKTPSRRLARAEREHAREQQRHEHLRGACPGIPPAGAGCVSRADHVWREHHRRVVLRNNEARTHRANTQAAQQEARVTAGERRAEHGKRAQEQQSRIDLARTVAVAHRADDEAHQDRRGDCGDVDIGDLVDGESELALDQRHQRGACEPREEADEERHPREMESTHGHGAQAEEIDPGCFVCHCLSRKQNGVP